MENSHHFLPNFNTQRVVFPQGKVEKGTKVSLETLRSNCRASAEHGSAVNHHGSRSTLFLMSQRQHARPGITGYLVRGSSSDSEKDLVPGNFVFKSKSCDKPVREPAGPWKAVENGVGPGSGLRGRFCIRQR